jgi:hypothetical protein
MCKIDIKFLPVHDIAPGLASNGFMTAPIYTVGKYANAFKKVAPPPPPAPTLSDDTNRMLESALGSLDD